MHQLDSLSHRTKDTVKENRSCFSAPNDDDTKIKHIIVKSIHLSLRSESKIYLVHARNAIGIKYFNLVEYE